MIDTKHIVFFGSPSFAVASLEAIVGSGRTVSLVVTQPDRPAGRGRKLRPPAVKAFCEGAGLPCIQPKKMKDPKFLETLSKASAELFVVAAYGRILPAQVLEIPKLILNVHASLLPRWRGASPIERAIVAGDSETGVSIMKIVQEMDAGDVFYTRKTSINSDITAGELESQLAVLGGEAIVDSLDQLQKGKGSFQPQDPSQVTFAPMLKKEEGAVDWSRAAQVVHNHVRGLNPWPGAYTQDGTQRIKIHRTLLTSDNANGEAPGTLRTEGERLFVATGDRWVEMLELQREGKAKQLTRLFLQGYRSRDVQRWGA